MKKLSFLLLFAFCAPSVLFGFSSTNVPIDDRVYRDIDHLVGAGLVKDVIYGQRPWSRKEIARIISIASKNMEQNSESISPSSNEVDLSLTVQDVLQRLRSEYREELVKLGAEDGESKSMNLVPLEQVQLDYTITDSPARLVPRDNNVGNINAVINPFLNYKEGRHLPEGNTIGLETTHRANLGSHFSLYVRPRFELLLPKNDGNQARPLIQQAYGKFTFRNFEIEAGRDSLIWGQGQNGGLLLSNNARPLDQIKFSSDSPFFLPGFLKYAGPTKVTLFAANLGPEREYPYSFLTGFKISFKPTSFLEIGGSQIVLMGGDGAPHGSFLQYLGEFFAVRPGIGFTTNDVGSGGGVDLSDRLMGADLRITIPPMNNSQIYYEMFTEACCGVFDVLYGYYGGIYVPSFLSPSLDLRIEFTHLPAIFYRHGTFTSGKTLNENLLGSAAGPDSNIASLELRNIVSENWENKITLAYENYRAHTYATTGGVIDNIYALSLLPLEKRYRVSDRITYQRSHYTIESIFGAEKISNFDFEEGHHMYNFLFQMMLRVKL